MTERVVHIVLSPYPRCYVYIHYDPRKVRRGEVGQIDHVVYVGKGTRARAWVDTRLNSPDHRRWLRDLQNQGFAPDEFVRIEKRRLTSEEAIRFERDLIAFYREKGVLLFNKERGWNGPVRTYESRWMPHPGFGKLVRARRPPRRKGKETKGDGEAMTEDDFRKAAVRTEDETAITYDLRPFEGRQQLAVAWYLGKLVFDLSARPVSSPSRAVVLLVDTRFVITPQLRGFARKLKAAGVPVEIRCLTLADVER
jgi:hypothetical protein